MLFHNNRFAPELLPDSRSRAVLTLAGQQPTALVRASDVVAAVLRHGDQTVLETLSQALRPGAVLQHLLQAILSRPAPLLAGTPSQRDRASFQPNVLHALDEFDQQLQASGGLLQEVALEVLLFCVLRHVTDHDREDLSPLDIERARDLFQEQLVQGVTVSAVQNITQKMFREGARRFTREPGQGKTTETPREQGPFLLPVELAPSDDLTHRARTAPVPSELPFDQDPSFAQLFDALGRALHRRQVHHVLLVGERGVGKATVVTELARRAATGQLPHLARKRFLSVDCRYLPADESRQRLVAILNFVAGHPELVVCFDGFAALLRNDRGTGNKPVLLAALSRARCQLIGLLTPLEYEELIADDPDFGEFFVRVEVGEPDAEVALKLLRHFARGLEQRFGVAIDDRAVREAVQLSATYILNDQLPAKALKILYRVCEDLDYERSQLGRPRPQVTADDVVRVVSALSGVPEETLRGIAEDTGYEQSLREVIFGQDHAVREVATELGLIKAGMTDPTKPASVMLFLGQTGTGKTEMAKALARFYSTSKRLKTYTLGNCVEPHSVSTIIGVPPGYVGTDRGGRLVNELNSDPYGVFLLDEADKAHPDVLQPFLNLFDEGWVCDQRGVRAYAGKSIFILTTNVGQRMIADLIEQGKSLEEIATRMKEALSQIRHSKSDRPVFTPEFLARIKRIIVFHPLGEDAMLGISRKLIAEMQEAWQAKRGKALVVPDALVEFIGQQAHQVNEKSKGKEGGRIVRKLLSEWLEASLQREISQRAREYREASGIEVVCTLPEPVAAGEHGPAPAIAFQFLAGPSS